MNKNSLPVLPTFPVIPAKAGIQNGKGGSGGLSILAFARMTIGTVSLVTLMMVSSGAEAQETTISKPVSASRAKKTSAQQKKAKAPITTTQQQKGVTEVPPVSVTTPAAPLMDGSAEAGYRVEQSTAAGPFWGDLKMQDSPYSVSVVPSALIKNQQVYDIQNAIKYVPGIQTFSIQGVTGTSGFVIRGFTYASQTFEGMRGPNAGGAYNTPIEDKESIEVLHGVSGFLYGAGSSGNGIGGTINMALKRPTPIPYFSIESGTNTGHNGFVHGDFGGPINIPGLTDGLLGYRLNVVGQGGDTQINNQAIKRNLISAAVDVHLAENLLVQFNGSYSNYHQWGSTPNYIVTTDAANYLMAPANPSKIYTMPQLQRSSNLMIGGVKVIWKPDDILTFRTQYNYTQESLSATNYVSANIADTGSMTRGLFNFGTSRTTYTHAGYSFVDADFDLFGVHNKLTTGFSGFYSRSNNGGGSRSAPSVPTGSCNFYNQSLCNWISANPGGVYTSSIGYVTGNNFIENYMIGDEIKAFDERLIILAGTNYAFAGNTSFNNTGAATAQYSASALTPTVAITYKLQPWLSVYASYQQSLIAGQVVGQTNGSLPYTNAYSVIAPYIGTQWETGVKATVGENMLATLSFFKVNQQNTYDQINGDGTATRMVGGSQVGKGIEFTMTGKVWEDLALFGGLTLLDNRIQNNPASPYQNGHLGQYVSPVTESLYAEYTIPYLAQAPLLHGLTLTGGFTYRSDFYTSLPSSYSTMWTQPRAHGYALGDLGFRYATNLYDHPVTFRFTVTNVTNHAYWINASNIGLPRTFLASAEFQW